MPNGNRVALPHLLGGDVSDADILSESRDAAPIFDHIAEGGWLVHLPTIQNALSKCKTFCMGHVCCLMYMTHTTPGDRLRRLRLKKYRTAKEAAQAYGWNEFTYAAHENGLRGIKTKVAEKYAVAFGSTASYILTGASNGDAGPVNSLISVPVLARISAGAFRADEGLEDDEMIVPAVPRGDIAAALQYSVIVDGPSVNKRIPDGAYAICAPYDSYPGGAQHGQLVHVVRERAGLYEHTIKELRFTRSGMTLMPVSDDPRYQEAIVLATGDMDESVVIRGIVIGSYQPF